MISGLAVLGVAEILKLVLVERLFSISRDKLLSIPAFAWCYEKVLTVRRWITSLAAWRLVRTVALNVKRAVRRYVIPYRSRLRAREGVA